MIRTISLGLLLLCQSALGQLQAPYLYTATAVGDAVFGDTAVSLTWRNNSTAYQGITILRKDSTDLQYTVVTTVSGTATSFTDICKPLSQITYTYALTAISQTEHADTSNTISVTVVPKQVITLPIFAAPLQFNVTYGIWTQHASQITFFQFDHRSRLQDLQGLELWHLRATKGYSFSYSLSRRLGY